MVRWFLMGALAMTGCAGDGDGGIFGGGGGGGGGRNTGYADVPSSAEMTWSETADLSDGSPESDLGFLESAQCVPGTQNDKFDGAWLWFTYEQPGDKQVYVVADPESGVDVSLVVSQHPQSSSASGASGIVRPCEEGLDYSGGNPGQQESVKVTTIGDAYHLVIGVAGAYGEDSGEVEVQVFEDVQ